MLVEKIIEELQKFPKGTEVCLYDWRKNLRNDVGDGSSEGIYPDFDIELRTLKSDEAEFFKEMHDQEFTPWIAIGFNNSDYNEDGDLIVE